MAVAGETSVWRQFVADLGLALRAWRKAPALPLLTIALPALWFVMNSSGSVILELLAILPLLFTIGFYGTQRLWYLRVWRGRDLSPGEVWRFSWSFLGRFVVLGLFVGWPLVVVYGVFTFFVIADQRRGPVEPAYYIGIAVFSLALDFLLTFVTPALAYTTRSASQALTLGVRMIRATWPAGALYVFFPPLALQLLIYQPQRAAGLSTAVFVVASAVAALVNLLFKGAVAAFYLRQVPDVGDDGAVVGLRHPTVARAPVGRLDLD